MNEHIQKIEKLAFGGSGVCRINGKVCFVPFSCPGDEVQLAVTSDKRSYCTARITQIVVPAPCRVTAPCPIFGRCGGCFWQHIGYDQQLFAKQQILTETLWRGARIDGTAVKAALPSTPHYGYRSRVQFKVQSSADRLKIGFYRTMTHVVEDLPEEGCLLAMPEINMALRSLRRVLASSPHAGKVTGIKLECGDQQVLALLTCSDSGFQQIQQCILESRSDLAPLTGVFIQTRNGQIPRKVYGDDVLYYCHPPTGRDESPCRLSYKPGGFAQVNRHQNLNVLMLVKRLGDFRQDQHVLDLFCGNGNFSLPIANLVSSVAGVEYSKMSIESALQSCADNGITNARYLCGDAAETAKDLADSGRSFETVILDPPRAGAAEAVAGIIRLNPAKIIYISCDPSTLARDCGLLAAGGYSVVESIPVDMFPHTYHIESVTLLQK
jgi:23S rRNA (uracil1939-C5)-methyltransferase